MKVTKKYQKISLAALIVSLLPLATLIPIFLHIALPDGVRSVWAIFNITSVLVGLPLSLICVCRKDSRSVVNIAATVISAFLALMMLGIAALALLVTFMHLRHG